MVTYQADPLDAPNKKRLEVTLFRIMDFGSYLFFRSSTVVFYSFCKEFLT